MMESSENKDYSLFPLDELKQKSKNNGDTLDMKKVFSIYNTCSIKTIIELKNKLENKYNYIEMGISVLYYIFFLVLRTSNNMKLCLKLSERAILLFTEFIIQSREKKASGDLVFSPSIGDAVSFAYKKTIGSVSLNSIEKDADYQYDELVDLKWIMKACETMNRIFLSFSTDEQVNIDILQGIKLNIYTDIYYLYDIQYKQGTAGILSNNINLILEQDIDSSNKWILLKTYLEGIQNNSIEIPISLFIENYKKNSNNNTNLTLEYAIDLQTPFFKNKLDKVCNCNL